MIRITTAITITMLISMVIPHPSAVCLELNCKWWGCQVAEEARKLAGKLAGCPPCRVRVPVGCLGGHTVAQLACSEAAPFCCGARCGQGLACGNHSCQKPCHLKLPGVVTHPCPCLAQRQDQLTF
jgi:hypothetical protein